MNELIDLLKCPLTGKIFLNPIIGNDNKIYERSEYIKVSENVYLFNLTKIYPIINLINILVDKYPHLDSDRYKINNVGNLFIENVEQINNYIHNGSYEKLLEFKKYSVQIIGSQNYINILDNADKHISKYLLSNTLDINEKIQYNDVKWGIVNCAVIRCNSDIVDMILETKNIDIFATCTDGYTLLHQILQHEHNDEFRKKFIDRILINANAKEQLLELRTDCNNNALSIAIKRCSKDIVKYLLDKLVNLTPEGIQIIIDIIESRICESDKEQLISYVLKN